MAGGELGVAVHAHCVPGGKQRGELFAAAEGAQRPLQGLRFAAVQPDHDVGIRAHRRDVVEAAHGDTASLDGNNRFGEATGRDSAIGVLPQNGPQGVTGLLWSAHTEPFAETLVVSNSLTVRACAITLASPVPATQSPTHTKPSEGACRSARAQ